MSDISSPSERTPLLQDSAHDSLPENTARSIVGAVPSGSRTSHREHPNVLSEEHRALPLRTSQRPTQAVTIVAVSHDSHWIASVPANKASRIILRRSTNPSIHARQPTDSRIRALAFPPERSNSLASAHDDGIRVWAIEYVNGKGVRLALVEQFIECKSEPMRALTWLPAASGRGLVAVSSHDMVVRIWDVPMRRFPTIKWLGPRPDALEFAVFSPNSALPAFGGAGGRCHIWDVELHEMKMELPKAGPESESENPVLKTVLKAAQFDARGETIAVLSNDGSARVWDMTGSGRLLFVVPSEYRVKDVSLSPDGRLLLIVLYDGRVLLSEWRDNVRCRWDALAGHSSAVESARFSPNGRLIVSALSDGTICLWKTCNVTAPWNGSE